MMHASGFWLFFVDVVSFAVIVPRPSARVGVRPRKI